MATQAKIVEVTPAKASEWLSKNIINRHVRAAWVYYLAEQLRQDRWQVTTDAIGIREDGALGNGQHRLLAIVQANRPAPLLVMEGLTDAAFRVLDTGIKRSAADALGISNSVAADATLIAHMLDRSTHQRVPQEVIADIVAWWNPIIEVLMEAAPKRCTGINNASVRCGAGLQWAARADAEERDYVLGQFSVMMAEEVTEMSRAVATVWKRMGRLSLGSRAREHRMSGFALTYRCFDPQRRDIEPSIKVLQVAFAEIRTHLLAIEEAFIKANPPIVIPPMAPMPDKTKASSASPSHRAPAETAASKRRTPVPA